MTFPSSRTLRGGAAAGLLLGALLLSSCGSSSSGTSDGVASASSESASGSASSSAGATGSTSPPEAPTASDSATAASSPSSPAGPPGCTTSALRAGLTAGDGAAGSSYFQVRLTNTSTKPCTVRGFGGVSFVTSATGAPIGAPADRVRRSAVRTVVLAPGRSASATLQQVEAGNYSAGTCRPTQATGLRIYPPDQTASLFVRHRATACRASSVHLLSLTPYTAG